MMPWLSMSAQDGGAFDAAMVERLAVIGRGCRCLWPGRSTRMEMMVVLVAPEHIGPMPLVPPAASPGAERQEARPTGGAVLS